MKIPRAVSSGCNRVVAALWAIAILGMLPAAHAEDDAGLSSNVVQQIQALQQEKASFTAVQTKMDSQLVFAVKTNRNEPIAGGAVPQLRIGASADAQGLILVDISATVTTSLLQQIQQLGGSIVSSVPQFNAIRARVPLSQVETVAGLTGVTFVRTAVPRKTRTGSVDSEGDFTHLANVARSTFHVDGTDVRVGVLSDSVDFLAHSQSLGDLGPVTVLPGQAGVGAGEGTAMLEIVHDLAPGATLFFATGFSGEASFAQNILDLRAAGCDIIVDDIFYFDESPFQDGVIAQAVNAVTANGAMYFSSAGNEGNLASGTSGTWEGDFVNGGLVGAPVNGKGGNVHRFGQTNFDTVTGIGEATVLHWSDPAGHSSNDYDLYILDATGANIVSASITLQNGLQDPFEIVPPGFPGERVVVVKTTGAADRFIHVDTIRGQLAVGTDGNITGHPAAAGAIAVAAVDVHTAFPGPFTGGAANPVEFFSTDGPRRVFFNVDGSPITPGNFSATGGLLRPKPDIAAADGVVTTLPPGSGLNPFFGTSAAAPHAASIAALLKSYNPNLTPQQVQQLMRQTALDIMAPGVDEDSGSGITMPLQALQAAPVPEPRPRLTIVTNIVTGGNGNGLIDPNECNFLDITLTNSGTTTATGVRASLSTTTPGVAILQPSTTFPDIPVGSIAADLNSFKVSTSTNFECGTPIDFTLVVKTDQDSRTNQFRVNTGSLGFPTGFGNSFPVSIPDANPFGVSSTVLVSNIASQIGKLTVSVYISHPFDSDLTLQLISPDGTTATLAANVGGAGQNFGTDCGSQTVFDDAATISIASGVPPFIGSFAPQQPLSIFSGKIGSAVNGLWQLHVVDDFLLDSGTIQCWSLSISPSVCQDGGGRCLGIDTALGMTGTPSSVIVGSNLVYTISVTNNGPDVAKGVAVNQTLPPSVTFVSASSSQGSVAFSSGLLTANLGSMTIGATATVTVLVIPTAPGPILSSATVGSQEPDFAPANNSATVATQVSAPTADLAVSLGGSPAPVAIGGLLNYTAVVTNKGPVLAPGVNLAINLPGNVTFISADTSQGSAAAAAGQVICNLGSLPVGSTAVVNVHVRAVVVGGITADATVSSSISDPVPGNNSASFSTAVIPSSDLSISMTGSPGSAVRGSNVTYNISVFNLGPSVATGVNISDTLPTNVAFVGAAASQGTFTQSNGVVNFAFGSIGVGANGTATVTVSTAPITTNQVPLSITNQATITSGQADPNVANNAASVATRVDIARPAIVAAGAVLVTEGFSPANGFIDPGETVTVNLRLQNIGNQNATNLVATLLAANGVTPSGPQVGNYGALAAAAAPVSQPFTFTAASLGAGVTATLQLQDGPNNLGTVQFAFPFASTTTFSNTSDIVIHDSGPATPYPSVINVSGVTGLIAKVTVTMTNVNHTFADDVDMLLVGPVGQTALLMSHTGNGNGMSGVSLTFDDSAPGFLPLNGQIASGSYKPTTNGTVNFPPTAPAQPYTSAMATFNGTNANGNWSLFVLDSAPGDQGEIFGGWSLAITAGTPVNQSGDVGITGTVTPNPLQVGNGNLTYTFNITNNGPNTSSSVSFTNILPAGLTFVSANSTQGTAVTNGNGAVTCLVGPLGLGTNVVITVVATPTSPGTITNKATATPVDGDLNQLNNTVSVLATITAPVADLAVGFTSAPSPAAVGNDLIYTISVTNNGPGTAFSTVVSNSLAGISFSSGFTSPPLGVPFVTNGGILCNLGNLTPGSSASVTLTVVPLAIGSITNVARAASSSADPVPTNNSVSSVITVQNPAPLVVAAGARLLTEGFPPPNGTIDNGENVTVSLTLSNSGSADTANLVATLLAANGVSTPSGAQNYGSLVHGGAAVSRSFTFTGIGSNGGVIAATLQLQDGATNLGNIVFNFNLPATTTVGNNSPIIIPESGPATPYPSIINISNLTGVIGKVTVTLSNLNHTFPDDLDILLVGPSGQKAILMSDAGGAHSVSNVTLTFDDAAGGALPDSGQIVSGTYVPTDYEPGDLLPPPAPAGPYGAALGAFNGGNPNGAWFLYVFDDTAGDGGSIGSGWQLQITTLNTVNPASDLGITLANPPGPISLGSNFNYTISVTNKGPANATGVKVIETLPPGLAFVSTSLGNSTNIFGGTMSFNIGNLDAATGLTFTVTVNPVISGSLFNSASVSGNELDLNTTDNQATVVTTIPAVAPARLQATSYLNGQFTITVAGQEGHVYVVEASTDLHNWAPVYTNTIVGGSFQYTDTNAGAHVAQYYRARNGP